MGTVGLCGCGDESREVVCDAAGRCYKWFRNGNVVCTRFVARKVLEQDDVKVSE